MDILFWIHHHILAGQELPRTDSGNFVDLFVKILIGQICHPMHQVDIMAHSGLC